MDVVELKEKIINTLLNSSLVRSNLVISLGRMIRSLSKSNFVEIEGRKMFTHGNDGLALSIFKVYEPAQTMAQLVGKKGKVFSFEPDPLNFQLLKKSVEINRFDNVILVQKAVSNTTEKIKLFVGNNDRAINRIYDAKLGDANESIEVESITLDEYFQDNSESLNFIKIDSEGSEVKIVNGMQRLLSENRKLVMMTEFFPFLIQKSGNDPNKHLKLLEKAGFHLYNILDKEEKTNAINSENFLKNAILYKFVMY